MTRVTMNPTRLNDPDMQARYPRLRDLMAKLDAVFSEESQQGATFLEVLSALVSFHASLIARTHPTEAQRERALDVLRQAIIECQVVLEAREAGQ